MSEVVGDERGSVRAQVDGTCSCAVGPVVRLEPVIELGRILIIGKGSVSGSGFRRDGGNEFRVAATVAVSKGPGSGASPEAAPTPARG
ncbi:MAG: hypothetical protein ACP5JB_03700 [candidate division WOR-3 bacterium]